MDQKNLVIGTVVNLKIPKFSGSFRRAKFIGNVETVAVVINDSYSDATKKHWFTFEILKTSDPVAHPIGSIKRMQGKNAYANTEIIQQPDDLDLKTECKNDRKKAALIQFIEMN